jgi:hypothetical protein
MFAGAADDEGRLMAQSAIDGLKVLQGAKAA